MLLCLEANTVDSVYYTTNDECLLLLHVEYGTGTSTVMAMLRAENASCKMMMIMRSNDGRAEWSVVSAWSVQVSREESESCMS